jgi:hypothetical protein
MATLVREGILAQAMLDATQQRLYTPPASSFSTRPTSIKVVNTDTSSRTFTIYTRKAGASDAVPYSQVSQSLSAGAEKQVLLTAEELRLGPGDELIGVADAADKVAVTLSGGEFV